MSLKDWRCDHCRYTSRDDADAPPARCPWCWQWGSVRRADYIGRHRATRACSHTVHSSAGGVRMGQIERTAWEPCPAGPS